MNDVLNTNLAQIAERLRKLERKTQLEATQDKAGNFTAGSVLFASSTGIPTQDNTNLFWDDTNERLFIGANSISAGNAKLIIKGTNANVAGPHIQTHTGADNYPLMQLLSFTHDNINLSFDAYYDGSWRSSDAGSNFQFRKLGDVLTVQYDSGVTAGSVVTWVEALRVDMSGNVGHTGNLQSRKNSTAYTGYIYVPLTTPLTSTSWDGDARSTTSKTLIDLSSVFSAPAGVKAISVDVAMRDSGSASTDCRLWLSDDNTAGSGQVFSCMPVNDRLTYLSSIVACDTNGDVYYETAASGSLTMDIWLYITGYWI